MVITLAEAVELAKADAVERGAGTDVTAVWLDDERVVVEFAPEPPDAIDGHSPSIVDRNTGQVHPWGSWHDPADLIAGMTRLDYRDPRIAAAIGNALTESDQRAERGARHDPTAVKAVTLADAAGRKPELTFRCPQGCVLARVWASGEPGRVLMDCPYRPDRSLYLEAPSWQGATFWLDGRDAHAGEVLASCEHRPSCWVLPDPPAVIRDAEACTRLGQHASRKLRED